MNQNVVPRPAAGASANGTGSSATASNPAVNQNVIRRPPPVQAPPPTPAPPAVSVHPQPPRARASATARHAHRHSSATGARSKRQRRPPTSSRQPGSPEDDFENATDSRFSSTPAIRITSRALFGEAVRRVTRLSNLGRCQRRDHGAAVRRRSEPDGDNRQSAGARLPAESPQNRRPDHQSLPFDSPPVPVSLQQRIR